MKSAIVKVTGSCSELSGVYGPFESDRAAAVSLTNKGWIPQKTSEGEVWIVANGRYHGVEARIENLKSVKSLQMNQDSARDPYRLV